MDKANHLSEENHHQKNNYQKYLVKEEQQAPDLAFYQLGSGRLVKKNIYETTLNPERASKTMMASKPQIHLEATPSPLPPCAEKQGPSLRSTRSPQVAS